MAFPLSKCCHVTLHNEVFSLLRPQFSSVRFFFSLVIILICFSDTNNQYSNFVSHEKGRISVFTDSVKYDFCKRILRCLLVWISCKIKMLSYLFNLSFMEAFCVVLPYLVIVISSPLLIMSKSECVACFVWSFCVQMSISFPNPPPFFLYCLWQFLLQSPGLPNRHKRAVQAAFSYSAPSQGCPWCSLCNRRFF